MELNKIYNEDCLETLSRLPDNCVDLIISDPPYITCPIKYKSGTSVFNLRSLDKKYNKSFPTLRGGFKNKVLDECKRICKIFNCYFFCAKGQILQILLWAQENNLIIDILCYHKMNPVPLVGHSYLNDTEYIIYMRDKGAYLSDGYARKKKYFLQGRERSEYDHPSVKPLNIIRTFVMNSTVENEIIFDPFMGSGTTAIACIKEKRNFLGSEIDQYYYNMATKRIANESLQTSFLF